MATYYWQSAGLTESESWREISEEAWMTRDRLSIPSKLQRYLYQLVAYAIVPARSDTYSKGEFPI